MKSQFYFYSGNRQNRVGGSVNQQIKKSWPDLSNFKAKLEVLLYFHGPLNIENGSAGGASMFLFLFQITLLRGIFGILVGE